MPFWLIALVILGATVAFNALMAARTKPQKRKAAGLGDFNFPTAQENREQPVIVGTVRQGAPNCTWFGDLQTIPIKKKVPNPAFFGLVKKTIETGQYRYFVGMKLDLGQGAGGVTLKEFQIDDKVVYSGSLASGSFSFDQSNLFGGEEKEGGYAGTFDYYGGSWTQTYDSYLESQLQLNSKKARNCKGNVYLIQRGPASGNIAANTPNGYIGISTSLKPFAFVLQRFPNNLSQPAYITINSTDANPIEWAYEILTNADYGAAIPSSNIDLAAFQAAAQTVYSEGLGISELWDSDRSLEDVINDIAELIDGAFFVDRSTGKWTVKLARADYDIEDLPIFDRENGVLEEIEFSTNTGKDAPSEIIVPYVDKAQNYKTREAFFKDGATRRNQAAPNQLQKDYYGVANGTQAAKLAFRDARVFASNLRKLIVKLDRRAHSLRPFSLFRYQRTDLETGDLLDIVFRAARVDDGKLFEGEIEVEALQDVFSLGNLNYAPPAATDWQPINGAAVAVATSFLAEQPYFLSGNSIKVWSFAKQPNGAQRNFDLYFKLNAEANYARQYSNADFAPTGTINSTYARTTAKDTSNSLIITIDSGLARLVAASASEIATNGMNLFLFADTGEICAFESITDNGNGTVTLNNVWRGLYDTPTESHSSGARVWFFSYGQALPEAAVLSGSTYNIKHVPNAINGALNIASATAVNITPANRQARPLPPVDVQIQGVANPTAIPAAGNTISFTWKNRNRLTQNQMLLQTDTTQSPEAGATVGIKIYNAAGTLLATREGLTGTSFSYTSAMQTTDGAAAELALTFVIYSIRSGVSSLQAVRFATARPTGTPAATLPTFNAAGTPPAATDYVGNLGGILLSGSPTSTNNSPVYDSATNTITWQPSGGLDIETIQDMIATFLQAGNLIGLTYNDAGNTLTISVDATNLTENVQDIVGAFVSGSGGITVAYSDVANTLTFSLDIESVQDIVGALITAGSGVNVNYNDAGNALTLSIDAEVIQDLISTTLIAGAGIMLTYDDAGNTLTITNIGITSEPVTIGDDGATPPEFVWTDDGEIIVI